MPTRDPHRPWVPHLEAFRRSALAWLGSRGFDAASADDLWQQIVARLLETGAEPDPERSPEAYLWTTLWRDAARARSRRRPVLGEHPLVVEVDPAPSPVEAAAGAEECSAVRAAVADLPALFRGVVERRFLLGQSVSEVAQELAIPGATVATRTHRGLALLRPRLARLRAALPLLLRRSAAAGLIAAAVLGPAAEVGVTEQHRLPPVERQEDRLYWIPEPPTAGFPYAEGFVLRPLPEA